LLTVIAGSTVDYIGGVSQVGGPAYYIGTALAYLGERARIATTRSRTSSILRKYSDNIEVVEVGVGETVFEIQVSNGGRSFRVLRSAKMCLPRVLEVLEPSSNVIVSTTLGELSFAELGRLVEGRLTIVDVQGFVRTVLSENLVATVPERVFELSRYLGSSVKPILRGERSEFPEECWTDPLWCAERLRADIVITDGEGPLRVAQRGDDYIYEVKPLAGLHGRPIGLGDVFTATLSHYLLTAGKPLHEAAAAASIAASLKLRDKHPWFTPYELAVLNSKISITSYRRTRPSGQEAVSRIKP
jgi:hypothetical protein